MKGKEGEREKRGQCAWPPAAGMGSSMGAGNFQVARLAASAMRLLRMETPEFQAKLAANAYLSSASSY
ncbi:MAG: hypothetical protein WA129_11730 [Acidovorax sp.]|jgi:hypothetical protein